MKIKNWKKIENGCVLELEKGIMEFYVMKDSVIRCRQQEKGTFLNGNILQIESVSRESIELQVEEQGNSILLQTKSLQVEVNRETGAIIWSDCKTKGLLLKELYRTFSVKEVEQHTVNEGEELIVEKKMTVDGERSQIVNVVPRVVRSAYTIKLEYALDAEEKIYGFGQGEEGFYNYRGKEQYLYQHNMRIPMPFFLSSKRYGIFLNTGTCMYFNDVANSTYLELDTVDQLEYYFISGSNYDKIIGEYRSLLGKAAMLPKWAFGYLQSKERYVDQEEIVSVIKKYRELQVPIDGVILDWHTWLSGRWGDKNLDPKRFDKMEEACQVIHKDNAHLMISVWPNMSETGDNHKEFADAGFLLNDYSTYNAFDESARTMFWKQANKGLYSKGVDAWWCDSTEPFAGPDWSGAAMRTPKERYDLVAGEHKKYIDATLVNTFSLVHAQGIYENQRLECPDKRVLNLTRSGYSGIHKYGVVLWSGDISATWDVFKAQITEGLNMCLSGIPYWTLDIGAFFTVKDKWENRGCNSSGNTTPLWFWNGDYNDGVADMGYRELYTRWLQFGAFLPMFRSHGTDTPREIWNFGSKGDMFYDSIEKFIKLRYELMPYIYSLAGRVTQHHYTMYRSLLFDYSYDEKVSELSREFMFGDYLLVCPVLEPMYYVANNEKVSGEKKWNCYLPQGNEWYDYWTNTRYAGGQIVSCDATIDTMPLFVKEGAILIKEEALQYVNEVVDTPLQITIYPGKSTTFLYYEDDGKSYDYESGEFNEILFAWDDNKKRLCISEANKKIPNSIIGRELNICLEEEYQKITYTGLEVEINF